jgi:hypothetical protein
MTEYLQENLVRNLIQLLYCFPLHINLAGRSQDTDEPCTSQILRNEFPNQADLRQKAGKFPRGPRVGSLVLADKSA